MPGTRKLVPLITLHGKDREIIAGVKYIKIPMWNSDKMSQAEFADKGLLAYLSSSNRN